MLFAKNTVIKDKTQRHLNAFKVEFFIICDILDISCRISGI
jgi:hypothetical protein